MTDDSGPETFEDRLLAELTRMVRDQPEPTPLDLVARRRGVRRPVLLAGAAAAVAAMAAAVVVLPGVLGGAHGAPSGFAVTRHQGGTVGFSVSGLVGDTVTAQAALSSAGAASVRVVSSTNYRGRCHSSTQNVPVPAGLLGATRPDSFVLDPARLPHGDVLIIAVPTKSGAASRVTVSVSADGTPPCAA
ncbi:MAG TPA: hypothetical protein VHX59_23990 [Mycobacteriales bacterium]|jgi:hypothetical protein|nr:hypothetical protein [Mycobacteriales bacterium]